jgi:hypothetical protein
MTAQRRRGRTALAAAGLALVLAAVAVVLVARDGGGGDGTEGRPGDRLESLDVRSADFAERWAAAIAELDAGDPLGELRWEQDESVGLEHAERDLATWGLLELYRREGEVVAVDLVGQVVSDDDRSRFRADTIAAVASALGQEADDATRIVDDQLGFGEADPEPTTSVDRGGTSIVVERSATSAELRISRT